MFDGYTDKMNFKESMASLEDLKESRDALLNDLIFANYEFLSIVSTSINFISMYL